MQPLSDLRNVLRVSVICDAMDVVAPGTRSWLGPDVTALDPERTLVGWAFPVRLERVHARPAEPYVGLLAALDALGPDDVWCVSSADEHAAALWGELLSTRGVAAGAAGAVIDGPIRDVRLIRELGFTCFHRGVLPLDINGRYEVATHGEPVELCGLAVAAGDLVVGDEDGVAVVPRALADEVVERAVAKAQAENAMRDSVAEGVLPSEAYRRHHVL